VSVRGSAYLGIGAMVGAGIFALLGEAGSVAGSAVWLSFLLAGIVSALRGYTRERFIKDLGAGLTVGIVALPLAMAFAIASGLSPQAGIWTAIIAGGLIALLGGSAVQIGGPAGAFIVVVYGIVEQYGLPNLLISTACAGVLLAGRSGGNAFEASLCTTPSPGARRAQPRS
jgi:hypothetical protein